MNTNIIPTFLAYIANLEQSDLVGLITDLAGKRAGISVRTMSSILNQNGVPIPEEEVEVISNHNLKHIEVCYSSNYNGCTITVIETKDGSSVDDYQETDEFQTIHSILEDIVVNHASDDCNDEGDYCGDIELLEEEVINMVNRHLPDVEVTFVEDSFST